MGKILLPPQYDNVNGPLIFIAGPIQGAPDWQEEAIKIIHEIAPDLNIASPRREVSSGNFDEDMYNEQVDWEHHYLEQAAKNGVIMFWLAKEANHISGRAYAQTSRFELGEVVTLHRLQGVKTVVGIEDGFSNARYLKKTISKKAPNIPVLLNLRDTCKKAIELVRA